MDLIQFDVADIAELGTQVAIYGAVRVGEMMADDLFDLVVGIVALAVQLKPPPR